MNNTLKLTNLAIFEKIEGMIGVFRGELNVS
ncbi:hypothetical protein NEOCIP111885_01945 [Pseudoneobacillus rhizosphaerae]|jgi:hypothetical protein|uniref:Uncharacterized protein n=1 Tax=Pseudoneobacillus rhizosphaerae TaxID=2880968 RepID=A0A9C7LAW0_9BACI|nr:hypothetical protein NEOCIP111885_01945 [Pseudoneobacillus rhizosphaerae]